MGTWLHYEQVIYAHNPSVFDLLTCSSTPSLTDKTLLAPAFTLAPNFYPSVSTSFPIKCSTLTFGLLNHPLASTTHQTNTPNIGPP